jgi:hypothetical protein
MVEMALVTPLSHTQQNTVRQARAKKNERKEEGKKKKK